MVQQWWRWLVSSSRLSRENCPFLWQIDTSSLISWAWYADPPPSLSLSPLQTPCTHSSLHPPPLAFSKISCLLCDFCGDETVNKQKGEKGQRQNRKGRRDSCVSSGWWRHQTQGSYYSPLLSWRHLQVSTFEINVWCFYNVWQFSCIVRCILKVFQTFLLLF